MKNRSFALVAIVVVAALLAAPAWNFQQDKKAIQAYIIKVVRDVEKKSPTTGWTTAVTLDQLKAGQEVRTAEKSFALIRFADESKIAVREKSIITIQGEVEGRQILNRNVHIDRGRVIFGIKKQETEQFRFSSPISVASIRGTEGGTGFDPAANEADITIIVGTADFTSTRTNCSTTVGAGQKGVIDSTGNCNKSQASASDLHDNNPNSNVNQGGEEGGGKGPGAKPDTTGTRAGGPGAPRDTTGTRPDTTRVQPPPPPPRGEFTLEKPGGTLTSGRGVQFAIALKNPPATVNQATLYYRIQGDPSYKQLPMTVSSQSVSANIPASDIRAGATKIFEYYLSMILADGSTYTFPSTNPDTSPFTLPITPILVQVKFPLVGPNGQSQYLTISYEQ